MFPSPPAEKAMAPTPVLLPGKFHGQRSLVGCSPWGWKSRTRLSDFTFTFHFSLSCTGEGNGNPLQCSCLENPRDWGAWWAAVYGVAQNRTRLKQLSSSNWSPPANWWPPNRSLLFQHLSNYPMDLSKHIYLFCLFCAKVILGFHFICCK